MSAADPVFVVGSGRSGTTIAARCLGAHPELLFIDEPRFLSDILLPAAAGRLTGAEFERRLAVEGDGSGKEPMKFLRRLGEHYGERLGAAGVAELRAATLAACRAWWGRLPGLGDEQRRASIRALVLELASLTGNRLGGRRWLVKQPDLSTQLAPLRAIFPGARFLHLERRAEDVVASRLDGGFQTAFADAVEVWASRLEAVLAFAREAPGEVLHVGFEELVGRPLDSLRRMLAFLGLPLVPEVVAAAAVVRPAAANIGRGARRFTPAEQSSIRARAERLDGLRSAAPAPDFSRVAGEYRRHRRPYPPELYEAVEAHLPPRPGTAVLDVGCGTGLAAAVLASAYPRVYGLDLSLPMLHHAARAAGPRVAWLQGRAEELPLRSRSVDLVTAFQAFHWLEPEAFLAETERVLRPGGVVALAWSNAAPGEPYRAAAAALIDRELGRPPSAARRVSCGRLGRSDRTLDLLARHGFSGAARQTFPYTLEWSVEDFVGFIQSTSWTAELTAARRRTLEAPLGARLRQLAGGERFTERNVAVLFTGVRC